MAGSSASPFARAIVRPASADARRGVLDAGNRRMPCALGRGGVRRDKREGDGATPAGAWPVRRVLYRADRLTLPPLAFAVSPIRPDDGWCDDVASPQYNQYVRHPLSASAERLWRNDDLYDVVVVLGHNDCPVVAGLGSAIFLHVARPDYSPTEGCIALTIQNLLSFLEAASPTVMLQIEER